MSRGYFWAAAGPTIVAKQSEIKYFENMSEDNKAFVRNKPFSSDERGYYLIDIGQILSLIRNPPARLLDLGCGSGWTTAMFAKSGYETLGVDIAPTAIDMATEAFGDTGAGFEVHDYENISFANAFDICVIYDCLHHAENEKAVLEGAFHALREGGEIVIVEPGRGHHKSATAQWMSKTHGVIEKDMPPRLTEKLLAAVGFSSINIFPRARYQMVEKNGTGVFFRVVQPFLGAGIAAFLKTLKNTAFTRQNGIVVAKKPIKNK